MSTMTEHVELGITLDLKLDLLTKAGSVMDHGASLRNDQIMSEQGHYNRAIIVGGPIDPRGITGGPRQGR
jgi:hypothetical protein